MAELQRGGVGVVVRRGEECGGIEKRERMIGEEGGVATSCKVESRSLFACHSSEVRRHLL